jgi:acetyl-CoA C-acetyltransferase
VPVIVGAAQLANKDPDRIVGATPLAAQAAMAAVDDAGADLLGGIDGVYSTPRSVFDTTDPADDWAAALGLGHVVRATSGFSGAGPLTLLARACRDLRDGRVTVACVGGAMAEASIKRATERGIEPPGPQAAPWSQGTAGRRDYDPRGSEHRRMRGAEISAGVTAPGDMFALIESSMAAAVGRDPDEQRAWLGQLMAPFTRVAATRPDVAWFPEARTPEELSTPTASNRLVAEPYTKRMNSFPTVDQAAALVVTTEEHADRLGVPHDVRVYPWSLVHRADAVPPSGRPVYHRSPALTETVQLVLRHAGVGLDDLAWFDLYSCFPAAVQLSVQALGLDPFDRRGLTLTGGLPYFGGPGANYVTHAIVCMVHACRTAPERPGLVVGLGGAPSDFAAGVFAAMPPAGDPVVDPGDDGKVEVDVGRVPIVEGRGGPAVVEAMTVLHDRDGGPVRVPLVARFPDGSRTGARSPSAGVARQLAGRNLVGETVRIVVHEEHATFEL